MSRFWCQYSLDNYVIFVRTFSMPFMFLIRVPFVALRQVSRQWFNFLILHYLAGEIFNCFFLSIIGILQSIDMITSLYENNFPMRFGVILYSSKFVKQIQMNSNSSAKENDNQNEEDISSSVIISFNYSYCLFVLHYLRVS